MDAVRVVGVVPLVGLTDSHPPPLAVVAAAVNCVEAVPLLIEIDCFEILEPEDANWLSVNVLGLATKGGAATTVRLTATATGLLDAWELIATAPE